MNLRIPEEELVRAEALGQQVHALCGVSVQLKHTAQLVKRGVYGPPAPPTPAFCSTPHVFMVLSQLRVRLTETFHISQQEQNVL